MKKFLLITLFLLLTNLVGAQVVVYHFNAGWNSTNDVEWIEDLEEVELVFIDIAKKPKLQQKWKIVVVPTILILQYDEEKKRYQADISFHMSATREEVQEKIDEIIMSGF
jgi:hypothetical protein|tara:strand:- start:20 stop:349 length:330 start_codon:yes stop_codon:yes gene_type:complete